MPWYFKKRVWLTLLVLLCFERLYEFADNSIPFPACRGKGFCRQHAGVTDDNNRF